MALDLRRDLDRIRLDLETDAEALPELREAAGTCTRCHLHEEATQTVFGHGPSRAELMLIGEQPGDQEDRQGVPFVGPAGRVLDRALEEAGIDRGAVYVTNLVKHFKFRRRGKRRIHATPNGEEIFACKPWLEAEIAVVRPSVVCALGASASKALYGSGFRVSRQRGEILADDGIRWTATVHPSSILRGPDEARADARETFTNDLRRIGALLG